MNFMDKAADQDDNITMKGTMIRACILGCSFVLVFNFKTCIGFVDNKLIEANGDYLSMIRCCLQSDKKIATLNRLVLKFCANITQKWRRKCY